MSAAIWSTPEQLMLDYPAQAFLQFFDNHRLMHLVRPIWRTVAGGSRSYVDKLLADLQPSLRPAARIETIRPAGPGKVQIIERDRPPQTFDAVILSCHADESRLFQTGVNQAHFIRYVITDDVVISVRDHRHTVPDGG